jgi:hypothetical protein
MFRRRQRWVFEAIKKTFGVFEVDKQVFEVLVLQRQLACNLSSTVERENTRSRKRP